MSYTSNNTFPPATRLSDVREFVKLLGYKKYSGWTTFEDVRFESYGWFDETDYRSWSGVELSIDQAEAGPLSVSTSSTVSRSHYDLVHQNLTITALRNRFGGTFNSDAGVGRYMRPEAGPPPPAASGCHLAFSRFGSNLIRALHYWDSLTLPNHPAATADNAIVQLGMHPRSLSANMLMAFSVSIVEDYLNSCFIALLKYSPQKEKLLRGISLRGDHLARVSNGEESVEQAVAETFSFQRISAACKNFATIDKKLDIAAALRKPFNRRRSTLFDDLEALADKRNQFVHRASLDLSVTDGAIKKTLHDLDVAMTRVQKSIVSQYGWSFDKTWSVGRHTKGA